MTEETRYSRKNRIIIIALVLVFFLPVLSAWYLVFFTDVFRNSSSVAHGSLIEPPRLLPDVILSTKQPGSVQSLHGKWTILALAIDGCGEPCRENLYRMRQIRLATGKEMNHVQRVLLHDGLNDIDDIAPEYPGQLFLSLQDVSGEFKTTLFQDHENSEQGLFIIDARGYLMMHYPSDTDPSGIIKDLKRLLRLSRTD